MSCWSCIDFTTCFTSSSFCIVFSDWLKNVGDAYIGGLGLFKNGGALIWTKGPFGGAAIYAYT
jgi:hypothetical protein